jgi:transposase
MAYTNHFKYLTPKVIEEIEARIYTTLIEEFDISMTTLFYDPTNFFTFINPNERMRLPKHGHSKEGLSTLNLVGLSLLCTQNGGGPLLHEVYLRNVQDANFFKEQIPRLLKRLKKIHIDVGELCLVFDKGNISREAFTQINEAALHFICSVRPSTQKKFLSLTPGDFSLESIPNGKQIGVREFERTVHDLTYRLLVVYNPRRRDWQEKNLKKKLEKKLETVHSWFNEQLNVKKWRDADAVEQKIQDILKSKNFLKLVNYSVSGEKGKVTYTIEIDEKALNTHLDTLGKSFFLSNHPTMSSLDLIWLYRQQYTVERAFKYIKSPSLLSVRPMFHRTDESIRGYLFTCVLGLLLLTLLTRKIQHEFTEMSIFTVLDNLKEIELAIIKYKGTRKVIKKLVDISPQATDLFQFLNLQAYI